MDTVFLVGSGLVAIIILLLIAMPEKFTPETPQGKKKKVGSSYWGVYNDADPQSNVGFVEVAPLPDKQKGLIGHPQYAKGKPISRRGA